jgi:hypothetical protein
MLWVKLEAAVHEQLRDFKELQTGYKADPQSKSYKTALHENFHDDNEMARFNEALENLKGFLYEQLDVIKTTSKELIELVGFRADTWVIRCAAVPGQAPSPDTCPPCGWEC